MNEGSDGLTPPAPPTTPVPLPQMVLPQPQWPKVLGIVGIVMASYGLLAGLWGLVQAKRMMAGPPTASMPSAVPESLQPWMRSLGAASLLLAALLLVASIGLLRRRAWSVRTLLAWAGMKAGLVVVSTVLIARIVAEGMPSQPGPAMSPWMMNVILVAGSCVGLPVGLAVPVFTLIWFNRSQVKDEVANWA